MKKSIPYAVLSSLAVAALVAAPAAILAAETTVPDNGFYIGGDAMEFYTTASLGGLTVDQRQELVNKAGGLSGITVLIDGKHAKLNTLTSSIALETEGKIFEAGDLAGNYTNGTTKEPVVIPGLETELVVESVMVITTTMFQGVEKQLEFAINGEVEAADVEALKEAGYAVSYQGTISVEATGKVTVNNTNPFEYKVVVSKDGEVVAESPLKAVTVKDGDAAAKILTHKLKQGDREVYSVVVGSSATLTASSYETLSGEEVKVPLTGVAFKSSNINVLIVNAGGTITPLREGTANVTISKAGVADYVVAVTVKEGARTLDQLTGLTNVSLSSSESVKESKTLSVKTLDQYGDEIGGTLNVTSSDATIATVGIVDRTITVTAVKEGTVTLTVKNSDNTKTLGTATVTVTKAGAISSYNLELPADASTTLDLKDINEDEAVKTLALDFVARDANGLLVKNLISEIGTTYKLVGPTGDDAVATAVVLDGKLVITPQKSGTATFVINQGTIKRAEVTVTVKDTRPATVTVDGSMTNLTAAVDGAEITFTYTAADKVFDEDKENAALVFNFNQAVKLESVTKDGVTIASEDILDVLATIEQNFVTSYVSTITIAKSHYGNPAVSSVKDVLDGVTLNLVNKAGTKTAITINFTAQ
jgi:hypothetical protein